jgi:hypothetical protein
MRPRNTDEARRGRLKEWFDLGEEPGANLSECLERQPYFRVRSLRHDWIGAELAIHCHAAFGPLGGDHGDSADLCAAFESHTLVEPEQSWANRLAPLDFHCEIRRGERQKKRNHEPMLVDGREIPQGAHPSTDGRATVRLKPLDQCEEWFRGNARKVAVSEMIPEDAPLPRHGEGNTFRLSRCQPMVTFSFDEAPSHVIETGPEPLQSLPEQERVFIGQFGQVSDTDSDELDRFALDWDGGLQFRLAVEGDGVILGIGRLGQRNLKQVSVLLCPIQLGPTTGEGIPHGA